MTGHHLYIRHGYRLSNDIDTPITDNCIDEVIIKTQQLVNRYGEPDYLVTSPYLRCRQTAELFNGYFDHTKVIYIDPRISSKSMALQRVWGSHHDLTHVGVLDPVTLHCQPPLNESRITVYNRVFDHKTSFEMIDSNIWIFTHRGFIRDLLELYYQPPRYLKCLEVLAITRSTDDNQYNIELIEG